MRQHPLVLGLLALSLAAPGIGAEPAPPATSQLAGNAVDPASIQALRKMGAYLQTLQRFQVRTSSARTCAITMRFARARSIGKSGSGPASRHCRASW